MKERPILFSAPMVRAILDGQKTRTRRVIKNQRLGSGYQKSFSAYEVEKNSNGDKAFGFDDEDETWICPYGQPGDRLWVRETWKGLPAYDDDFEYRADWSAEEEARYAKVLPWKPSIHMPRRASRITLEITGIRVELLNTISNTEILREGIRSESCNICVHTGGSGCEHCFSIINPFKKLWESINGPGSWAENPWVWVIEFKMVTP